MYSNLRNHFSGIIGLLCLLIVPSALVPVMAQLERPLTNAELNIQKLFIDANREKLLGAFDKAASLYLEVLELDDDNDGAQYELARVYEALDQNDKALTYINFAIRGSADNEWYYVMKGGILEGMEEYAAAVDVYEKLISLNPKQGYYYEHLVGLLERTNQLTRALDILNKHELVAGVIPELIFEKVDLYNETEQPQKGIAELDKLVRLYPGNTAFLHRLATQHIIVGDVGGAQKYYEQILALDPEDGKANLALAAEFKKSGDDLTYLKSIRGLMSNPAVSLDVKVIELIPFVEKFANNPRADFGTELGEVIAAISAQYPNEAKAHALYADFLFNKGDLRNARQEYERTLVLDKSVFAVWEQLLYLKLEQQDFNGVLTTAEKALDVFPNQASVYHLSGLARYRKQDWQGAANDLQQALIMSGRNAKLQTEILMLLGNVYQETGQGEKAVDALAKAAKLSANDAVVLNSYAYLLAVTGQSLDVAKEMALKASEIKPASADVEHTLAWIAFQSNDLNSARAYMEKSMEHGGGDDYRTLEHYGDIRISMGETDQAIEYWQLSLESGNPSEVLKRKIAERRLIH
jgi:tetratricopeptide (TPR) repeat protein